MVRVARIEDSLAISKVLYESWLIAYKGVFRKQFLDELKENRWVPFLKYMFNKKTGSILVIEEDGDIIGASLFGASRDDSEGYGEVYSFYITPEYWRKNFGRQLMEATLSCLNKNYQAIDVWVLEENNRAVDFYEALGFRKTGEKKDIIEDETILPHILLTHQLKEV